MSRVNRMVYALPVLVGALLPLSAAAAPSPSPTLDQILAPPPSGFSVVKEGTLNGHFNAHGLGTTYSTGAAEAENTAIHDGFVDGYTLTWLQQSTSHTLIEFIVAFEGGQGARSFLSYDEASAKSDPKYQHSDSITGIDPYYGVHLFDPSGVFLDGFTFVKGNDMFGVAFVSTKDDVLNLATSQAGAEYAAAPSETIPSAQWPENAIASPSPSPLATIGGLAGQALIVVLILGVIGVVVGFAMRSRRRTAVAPPSSWVHAPSVAAPLPVPLAGAPLQLSPDGNMWWDGQSWRDSFLEAPPFAQRSASGRLWWDGRNWRPVPPPPPAPAS
jgi:hypothetical protein